MCRPPRQLRPGRGEPLEKYSGINPPPKRDQPTATQEKDGEITDPQGIYILKKGGPIEKF